MRVFLSTLSPLMPTTWSLVATVVLAGGIAVFMQNFETVTAGRALGVLIGSLVLVHVGKAALRWSRQNRIEPQ